MHTPDTTQAAIERMRDKLLALTDALAPRLIGAPQAEVEAKLMEAVLEALKELPPDDGPASDPQPAA